MQQADTRATRTLRPVSNPRLFALHLDGLSIGQLKLRPIAIALLALSALALAQDYPAKPIRMIVTYPPGGGADLIARLVAPKMSTALGQTVVVENRPGASGMIGAELVANSQPDGYTLMLDASSHAVTPSLYAKMPYDPSKAFTAVSLVVVFP